MPTYNAVKVSATLFVAPLKGTLDADLKNASARATALLERPIGADGTAKGVLQFIGEFEGMPFLMAEAGEHIQRPKSSVLPTTEVDKPLPAGDDLMTDSPLTSLPTTPNRGFEESSRPITPQGDDREYVLDAPQPFSDFAEAQPFLRKQQPQQALFIALDTYAMSHLSKTRIKKELKAMKVEIFVNGHLANVHFVNPSLGQMHDDKPTILHFGGTRDTKVTEKPWVYTPVASKGEFARPKSDAQHRWKHVSAQLLNEARIRGVHRPGIQSPSAEYIQALADIALPDRLRDYIGLGTIDMVITVGTGGKFGPGAGMIEAPTRMRSTRYPALGQAEQSDDHSQAVDASSKALDSPDKDSAFEEPMSEANTPATLSQISLAKRTRSFQAFSTEPDLSMPPPDRILPRPGTGKSLSQTTSPAKPSDGPAMDPSPTHNRRPRAHPEPVPTTVPKANPDKTPSKPKKLTVTEQETREFAKELGITLEKGMVIPSFTNNRGKVSTNRSLAARLSDIIRMSASAEKGRAIQEVKEHFVDKDSQLTSATPITSSRKKAKSKGRSKEEEDDNAAASQSALKPSARKKAKLTDASTKEKQVKNSKKGDLTTSPQKNGKKERLSNFPATNESEENPAPDDNPTLSKVATRLRRDSAISFTPLLGHDASPVKATTKARAPVAQKAPRVRAPKEVDKAEVSVALPDLCLDSAVSYAGGDIRRKIMSTRPGEFEEDELVCGMRWVVI